MRTLLLFIAFFLSQTAWCYGAVDPESFGKMEQAAKVELIRSLLDRQRDRFHQFSYTGEERAENLIFATGERKLMHVFTFRYLRDAPKDLIDLVWTSPEGKVVQSDVAAWDGHVSRTFNRNSKSDLQAVISDLHAPAVPSMRWHQFIDLAPVDRLTGNTLSEWFRAAVKQK